MTRRPNPRHDPLRPPLPALPVDPLHLARQRQQSRTMRTVRPATDWLGLAKEVLATGDVWHDIADLAHAVGCCRTELRRVVRDANAAAHGITVDRTNPQWYRVALAARVTTQIKGTP